MLVVVSLQCNADLAEVIAARDTLRGITHALDSRDRQRGHDQQDRQDDQQFNERNGRASRPFGA